MAIRKFFGCIELYDEDGEIRARFIQNATGFSKRNYMELPVLVIDRISISGFDFDIYRNENGTWSCVLVSGENNWSDRLLSKELAIVSAAEYVIKIIQH